jgi:uncharacterized protein YndB with AHSA1/START domain
LLDVEIAQTVFEPRVGGGIYDQGVDGSEYRWARVLVFEPPTRLVFSWDISPQWQIDRTRVELEHRNLDRHGDGWENARDAVGGEGGWPLYLQRFAAVLEEPG